MLCFSNGNLLTHQLDYKTKVYIHWVLQVIAACCTLIGFIVVVIHKFNFNKNHFHTNHALYGLIAMIISAVSMGLGVLAKNGYQLRHILRPVVWRILHSAFALINYLMVTMTVILGFYSSWFGKHGSVTSFYICFVLIMFVTQYVIYSTILTLCNRLKSVWMRSYEL